MREVFVVPELPHNPGEEIVDEEQIHPRRNLEGPAEILATMKSLETSATGMVAPSLL
jgi:hypothetical protein